MDNSMLKEQFSKNLEYISQEEIHADIINNQFIRTENRYWLTVGKTDFSTGKVIVADPLAYLYSGRNLAVLRETIPSGSYNVDIAIARNEYIGIRMCTARLRITEKIAVRYVEAEATDNTCTDRFDKSAFFPVDAGMMCFCDELVAREYYNFLSKWHKDNPGKNHYDDYFATYFAESYEKLPGYQREEGDFITWTIPETNHSFQMIASGFGDGLYQAFLGLDEDDNLCNIVVPMINPLLFE